MSESSSPKQRDSESQASSSSNVTNNFYFENFSGALNTGEGNATTSNSAQNVSNTESPQQTQPTSSGNAANRTSAAFQLDENLIQRVRERCRQKILEQHSRMRLLSGEEIGVDQLYVDVWLLGKPEHKHFPDSDSLLKSFDIAKDRLALSKRIQRNPGFEIANGKSKLVILGKPGSGKTTFLKHLAVDWCQGKFQPEKIAVLIELRRIREQTWDLVDAIGQELGLEDQQETSILLEQGKLLVLMDGLDEVPTSELRQQVQTQISQVAAKCSKNNRFILTCRTQIMGTIPNGFTSVEVADFGPEQVRQFVQNWFRASGLPESEATQQWEEIQLAISQQPDLGEITATPVLLSLLCLVLQDQGEMPTNRGWLYGKGIKLLLNRWNNEKAIDEWEIGAEAYRQLSLEAKEALLIEIAARKFENPKNFVFFEQDELAEQISQKLHLANVQEGITVLKAIEAQHGLLIERADELWSFSHLAFQEYFTVQWLTQLSSKQLAEKMANPQWQEVLKQLVKRQQPADQLIRLTKRAIDQVIAHDVGLQAFLNWLAQKTTAMGTGYTNATVRSFYYLFISKCDSSLILDFRHICAITNSHITDTSHLAHRNELKLDLAFNHDLEQELAHINNADFILDTTLIFILDSANALTLGSTLAQDLTDALNLASTLARELTPNLTTDLHQLEKVLPLLSKQTDIQQWWQVHGNQWIDQIRQVAIKHRNIGHDWQFTEEQKQQLQRYYDANKFLVDLMKIEGAVTEACRAEIEDGLLLPWAELQRRFPQTYGGLEEF